MTQDRTAAVATSPDLLTLRQQIRARYGHLYLAVEAESGGFDAPGARTDEENGTGGELARDVQRFHSGGKRYKRALKAA
ncbi:MAG: hypothetical protein ACKO9B_14760 [Planctomycetota bacterium]